MSNNLNNHTNRVVIVGGGFGGIAAAKRLKKTPADITLIDKQNHHLFQPLLYQVATAALNPADIAAPIRKIFRKQKNLAVALGEVEQVNLFDQEVVIGGHSVPYDYLVLAAGAGHSYFGNDSWSGLAPGLKTVNDATEIRRRFLLAFEEAELETDEQAREACLTFVVVGAGPTGCELAGTMAEIAHDTIPSDFRNVDTKTARIILIEGSDRVLPGMAKESSAEAHRQLEELGVEIILNQLVTDIQSDGVICGGEHIPARCVLWAAGVQAASVGKSLGVEQDRAGRIKVGDDLSIPGHPNVFVIGDQAAAVCAKSGKPVPGVAQGALQGGNYVGNIIDREINATLSGKPKQQRKPFTYFDKGSLATIGKHRAVAEVMGFKFSGFLAWLLWAGVHIMFLVNFRNKVWVGLNWAVTYFFGDRGARLITGKSRLNLKQPPTYKSTRDSSQQAVRCK